MTAAPPSTILALHVPEFRYLNGRAIALPALTVNIGEIVALRGRSGSGKSTLLHLACGVLALPNSAGELTIAGRAIAGLSQRVRDSLRPDTVGWIPQRVHLISALNVLDNVLLPYRFAKRKEDTALEAHALNLLAEIGLAGFEYAKPETLSVGQASRACVVRAMVAKPQLLCADEPSAALDRDNAALIARAFANYAANGGAVLLATHDDEFLAQIAGHTQSLRTLSLEAQ